jgi:hypothetical protein
MHAVRRRLHNFLTVLSLLMCVAVCVLWVRGNRHQDNIGWGSWARSVDSKNQERWFAGVASSSGVLAVGALRQREGDAIPGPLLRTGSGFFWNQNGWPLNGYIGVALNFYGFAFLWLNDDPTPVYLGRLGVVVCVPFWAAVLITATLPVAEYRSIQRRRRRRQREATGRCPVCGYDLRGNESGVCPECGGVATGAAAGRLDHAAASAEPPPPPLGRRVLAWVLVWVASAMILVAAWPDLRRVLLRQR